MKINTSARKMHNLSFPQYVSGNPEKTESLDARQRNPGMTTFNCRLNNELSKSGKRKENVSV
jgi:hypothetical protein